MIKELNKQKFGNGYITAEYKKDKEEDQNVGPDDIDPLTLYVGNLAQEITKEDMVKTYPKVRRIDIGYAKKMKYTRYAFVSFNTVADAIEAFKKTHSTELYSKSLIVRFRRLHGPVGMPGESKQQNPPKSKPDKTIAVPVEQNGHEESLEHHTSCEDLSLTFGDVSSPIDISFIKEELEYSDEETVEDLKARIFSECDRILESSTLSVNDEVDKNSEKEQSRVPDIKQEPNDESDVACVHIKTEPHEENESSDPPIIVKAEAADNHESGNIRFFNF